MNLLDERQALIAIRALLDASDTARLAVAFWGAGAISRLGLDRSGLSAQVLCNLDSGACNPAELRKIRELPGISIRSHPSLHAKVYWTPEGAVLGSSNASTNGLALEGDAASGWAEANVRLADRGVLQEIEVWFDRLFAAGYVISEADLNRAEEIWQERAKMAPPGTRLLPHVVAPSNEASAPRVDANAVSMPSEQAFTQAMWEIYRQAVKVGYKPTTFLRMLTDYGGIETAHRLIQGNTATSGFTVLWEKGRLDLSVEALVLAPRWTAMFSVEERNIARKRLVDHGYKLDA